MLSIYLNNLSFFAYHGLYEEERINGNEFVINAVVKFLPTKKVTELSETIDYSSVYALIHKRMQVATPLLETIVMELAEEILDKFTLAKYVSIDMTKMHPPIYDFNGSVGVKFEMNRNQTVTQDMKNMESNNSIDSEYNF